MQMATEVKQLADEFIVELTSQPIGSGAEPVVRVWIASDTQQSHIIMDLMPTTCYPSAYIKSNATVMLGKLDAGMIQPIVNSTSGFGRMSKICKMVQQSLPSA